MTPVLRDERGETLIELLITVVVISLGMVTLMGAVGTSIIASDAHRGMASGEVILRDFAEAIKVQAAENVDDPATSAFEYVSCPTTSVLDPAGDFVTPDGWSAPSITGVEYWNPTLGVFESSVTACAAHWTACGQEIEACDWGSQRVTFSVSNQRDDYAATTLTASVVVRRPNPEVTP